MNELRVEQVRKDYEGKPLLRGISFSVSQGETLCLLGKSGSGKSTILRIIAGIENPDSGSVLWNGGVINNTAIHKRNFSLMFQDYALFPHLNVRENVAFGLRMRKVPADEQDRLVKESLARVNMSGFEQRRVTDLSGGEQQRIALARALAPRPALLMLDEPLAALDHSLRVELQEELRVLLKQADIPVIYVTHDQEEAVVLGDRLALLNDGVIVQSGETESVYQHPLNRWVAEFLGMTNFLEGAVSSLVPLEVKTCYGYFHPVYGEEKALRVEQKVTLLLRSTGVNVVSDQDQHNRIQATVSTCSFRGEYYRINLETCEERGLEFLSTRAYLPGESVSLYFAPSDLVLFV